uniref:hypothetical protein n=1 Tax=Paenibacillus sp. GbtcB18 TaxID=2824763 RepID=UPI001C2FC3BB
ENKHNLNVQKSGLPEDNGGPSNNQQAKPWERFGLFLCRTGLNGSYENPKACLSTFRDSVEAGDMCRGRSI